MNRAQRRLIPAAALSLGLSVLLTGCGGETEASEILGTPTASASATTTDAYEPATPEHPAHNVPRPVLSEQAKENNEAGARAFLEYWADCVNYMVQTGDSGPLQATLTPDNHKYDKPMKAYGDDYKENKWSQGTNQEIKFINHHFRKIEKYTAIDVKLHRSPGAIYNSQGLVDKVPSDGNHNKTLVALLYRTSDGWKLSAFQDASTLKGR